MVAALQKAAMPAPRPAAQNAAESLKKPALVQPAPAIAQNMIAVLPVNDDFSLPAAVAVSNLLQCAEAA
jgi:hypothetical protein